MAQDEDWPLDANGHNRLYDPFLHRVNQLAKAGQAAGNIAGSFNPLVNTVTAVSGQNPDGSCASTWERIAAGASVAGGALGEAGEGASGLGQGFKNLLKRWFGRRPQPPYEIYATVDKLFSVAIVDGYKAKMLAGEPIEAIGGIYVDGRYYIGEGHHRITAALEIFWETENDGPLRELIRSGAWTPDRVPPSNFYKFPLKR